MYVQQDNEAERLADPSDRATQEEHIHVSDAVAEHRRLAALVIPPAIEEDPETGAEVMTGECACGCGREVHPPAPGPGLWPRHRVCHTAGAAVKYVVMQVETHGLMREFPVIFPDGITHKDMAEALRRLPDMRMAKPVSAGFVSSTDVGPGFHGESESLGLESRERADDELVAMLDYSMGLVF